MSGQGLCYSADEAGLLISQELWSYPTHNASLAAVWEDSQSLENSTDELTYLWSSSHTQKAA